MGVSGAGKTTIGRLLSDHLEAAFIDADDYHSSANLEKMSQGRPLSDSDRGPWLAAVVDAISETEQTMPVVVACSALKDGYRRFLASHGCEFVYLKIDLDLAIARIENRQDHFMPSVLVASQFQTLEEPEDALIVDAAMSLEALMTEISRQL